MTAVNLRRIVQSLDALSDAIAECVSELRAEPKFAERAPALPTKNPPRPPIQNGAQLLDTHEAARFLGIKPQTLMAWRSNRRRGAPRHTKVGRLVRYRRSDLETYIERNSTEVEPREE